MNECIALGSITGENYNFFYIFCFLNKNEHKCKWLKRHAINVHLLVAFGVNVSDITLVLVISCNFCTIEIFSYLTKCKYA